VILTALGLEYDAVRAHLTEVRSRSHPAGTRFDVGNVAGVPWPIAVGMTGDGKIGAGLLAERAISLFDPEAVLFVGVAGALDDDLALGDVIVPTRIYAYHGGKQESEEFQVRPRVWNAPHHLEQLAGR
jgi:adenosylhomocysteine nucleosidase